MTGKCAGDSARTRDLRFKPFASLGHFDFYSIAKLRFQSVLNVSSRLSGSKSFIRH